MATFREILDHSIQQRGETTPAMELMDEYRETLDRLKSLLETENASANEIFKTAKRLDDMQSEFRLEYLLASGNLERKPMADLIRETNILLRESATSFPHKQKILTNSESREQIIRSGKEPQ